MLNSLKAAWRSLRNRPSLDVLDVIADVDSSDSMRGAAQLSR